eukprot:TRINITY_DN36285_c0_g1_i1.p1 TRINITY_DN36285_c0_g1~~TRINITY_DN36285_c0_g1_i1.p1  ORF type:complete len:457 (-),score=89.02 TRINITY_DN36285_c0_g1_i1:63-1394(-)
MPTPSTIEKQAGPGQDESALSRLDLFIEADGGGLGHALKLAKHQQGGEPKSFSRSSSGSQLTATVPEQLKGSVKSPYSTPQKPQRQQQSPGQASVQISHSPSSEQKSTAPLLSAQAEARSITPAVQEVAMHQNRLQAIRITGDDEDDDDTDTGDGIMQVYLGSQDSKPSVQSTRSPMLPSKDVEKLGLVERSKAARGDVDYVASAGADFGTSSSSSKPPGNAWTTAGGREAISESKGLDSMQYLKALNDPYVKALAQHRKEIYAAQVDLESEYVDTMASRLSTQRSGALSSLNQSARRRQQEAATRAAPVVPSLLARHSCYCANIDEPCYAETPRDDLLVMVPYYYSKDGDGMSAHSTTPGNSGRSEADQIEPDLIADDRGQAEETTEPSGWLSDMSKVVPGLPDLLGMLVGAEPRNDRNVANLVDRRRIPFSELTEGMETRL